MSIILGTERLTLRVFAPSDVEAFAPICADPEVMRYYRAPWTREVAETFIRNHIARQERRGYSLYAVDHRSDGRLIGFCGLVEQWIEDVQEIEIGYMLARPYWGTGLATEAARAVHEHAQRDLGLRRLISIIHPQNRPSIRVAEKSGMHLERELEFNERPCLLYARNLFELESRLDKRAFPLKLGG